MYTKFISLTVWGPNGCLISVIVPDFVDIAVVALGNVSFELYRKECATVHLSVLNSVFIDNGFA